MAKARPKESYIQNKVHVDCSTDPAHRLELADFIEAYREEMPILLQTELGPVVLMITSYGQPGSSEDLN